MQSFNCIFSVQETKFMTSLEPFELCDLEPLAANCTQVLLRNSVVWYFFL